MPEKHGAVYGSDTRLVLKDADDVGPPLNLFVEWFERVGVLCDFGGMLARGKSCKREHVLAVIYKLASLGQRARS